MKLKASAQVLIQLRRFNEQVLKAKAAGPASPPSFSAGRAAAAAGIGGGSRAGIGGVNLNQDMSEVLSTGGVGEGSRPAPTADRKRMRRSRWACLHLPQQPSRPVWLGTRWLSACCQRGRHRCLCLECPLLRPGHCHTMPCPGCADAEGIDASILGILKRVVVLLLALSLFGTALFYLGLKYAFPDSPY